MKKLATARYVLQTRGIRGVLAVLFVEKLPFSRWKRAIARWLVKNDHWWAGKLVELRGNMVTLEGYRLSVDSPAISTRFKTRFLLDTHEKLIRKAVKRFLDPRLPVVEFGGCIGAVACLTNKRMECPGRHVVVEANPSLVPLLEANRNRNSCKFTVLHRALAYGTDGVAFRMSEEFLASSVHRTNGRPVKMPSICLQQIVDRFGFDQINLICDVESAEIELVRSEPDCLRKVVRTFVVEAHASLMGVDAVRDMLQQLETLGFDRVSEVSDTYVFENRAGGRPAVVEEDSSESPRVGWPRQWCAGAGINGCR